MAGLTLSRWLFPLMCRWFPERVRVRRRPVVRYAKPMLTVLEDRWSPTSLSGASSVELASPLLAQVNSDMAPTVGEERKSNTSAEVPRSEDLRLVSPAHPADEASVVVRTPALLQYSYTSTGYQQQEETALNAQLPQPSSRPISPLSTPPKALATTPTNAGAGGVGGRSGSSTPNAGMGGGGPTGGGGGPGAVNANQFVGVNFGAVGSTSQSAIANVVPASQPDPEPSAPAGKPELQAAVLTPLQTTYSMTSPALHQQHPSLSLAPSHGHGHDPLYVLDMNTGETVPANVTLNTFSSWSENLLAQVSGATVSSYSWNVSQAPDLTNVSGTTSANLQGTWASFTGAAHTDTISVTETPQVGQPLSQTITFSVAGTDSPAYSSSRPTTSSTWPTVITPDKLGSGQAMQAAGAYASIGLADGSVQTSFSMPSYNPNTTPVSLDYNSTTANAQPIFVDEYQLPFGQAVPSTISAQLTFNSTPLATVTYNTSGLNPGDIVQIALQANATTLTTGRYPWSITVTNSGTPTTTSGNVDIVNGANSPYGAGWSLDNVEQLVSVSGGMMLVNPDGTSLYFANNGQGGFIAPAGDFSTLTLSNGVYTRAMPDGTRINFNSSGQQTSIVDRDGNTTTFGYSNGLLTNITDMNNQVTTLVYTNGLLSTITDPANRIATLTDTGKQLTSITDPANDVWQYTYDTANDLTKLTDPNTHATSFTYNSADRISTVTGADTTTEQLTAMQMNGWAAAGSSNVAATLLATGDRAQFTDGNNNVWTSGLDWLGFGKSVLNADPLGDTSLTYRDTNGLAWLSADALGRRTREFFNSQGDATKIVQPDDSYSQYQYNSFSEPTQYTDPTGAVTTYTYNSKGDLTQKADALLHTWTYTYNAAGLPTSQKDPLLNTTTYNYNTLNEVTGIVNALNKTTTITYNNYGQVASTTDPLNYTATYAYDAMNRLTGKTLPDSSSTNSVYSYSYDKVGNQTSITDPLNHVTTNTYNAVNELTGVTDALNQTTTYGYDADGNQTTITNPLNQTTTNTYNAANELVGVTNALNYTYTTTYDAAGEKTSQTDPLNHTTTYTYTLLGKVATVTDALNNVTTYTYDAYGDVTSISQKPSGISFQVATASMTYNPVHEETGYTDQNNNQTTYAFDADGNKIGMTDALNHTTTYTYNALNQLSGVTNALNQTTTYTYDADGNRVGVTTPLNKTTTTTYDAQGRVLTVTAPNNGVTTYTYDLEGNQTSITDPDNYTTTYTYNAIDQVATTTNPMGYQTTNSYNGAGLLTATTDGNGRTIDYGYNAIGQETSETWVGGNYTATYQYNAAGLLTSASDPYSTYTYVYDADNHETSASNAGTPGVPTVTLSYGYDAFGNRTSLADSLGGSISYTFDADKNLTGLSLSLNGSLTAQVTMSYDAAERLTGMTRTAPSVSGDTLTTSYSYDNANELTNITHTDTTQFLTLANYTYGYNVGGQLTSYQDNNNSSLTDGYDANGELTSASGTLNGSNYSVSYSYDANGNRTMTGYTTARGNELTSDGTYNYTYDNVGNTTSQTKISTGYVTYYSWDYRNRLTEVKLEDNHNNVLNDEKFTYDVNNNRIGVSLNGTQQLYTVYNGTNPYIDFNGSGTLSQRYLTNPKALSQFYGQISGSGTTQWSLTDNINSIRQVVSTNGSVLDAITYDPYGKILNQSNVSNAPRFLYTGGAVDSLTGAYEFKERYYSPSDGRFETQDPIGFKAGDSSLYRYTFNQPTSITDPSGEIIPLLIIGIVGISTYLVGASLNKYSQWSMQNQSSSWALSMTYARWGRASGQILMSTGLAITAAPVAAGIASLSPLAGLGMLGFGIGSTIAGVQNISNADQTGWEAPEYVGAYGSLAAPWMVGAGWYAGYKGGYLPGPLGGYRPPVGAPPVDIAPPVEGAPPVAGGLPGTVAETPRPVIPPGEPGLPQTPTPQPHPPGEFPTTPPYPSESTLPPGTTVPLPGNPTGGMGVVRPDGSISTWMAQSMWAELFPDQPYPPQWLPGNDTWFTPINEGNPPPNPLPPE